MNSPPGMEFYPLSNVLRVRASTDFVRAKLDLLEEAGAKLDTDLFEFHDAFLLNTMVARGLLDEETRIFAFRLRHETDHLRRYQTTSYGLYYHYLNSGITWLLFRFLREKLERREFESFPFVSIKERVACKLLDSRLYSLRREDLEPPSFDPIRLRKCVDYLEAMKNLDGVSDNSGAFRGYVCVHDWEEFLAGQSGGRQKLVPDLYPPDTSLIGFRSAAVPDCPQVFGRQFGARHLLEFLAVTREQSLSIGTGDLEAQDRVLRKLAELSDYGLVGEYLRAYFSDKLVTNPQAQDWPNELRRTQCAGIPIELIAAAELALWIPLIPSGFFAIKEAIAWHDIHPGWRFLKICRLLKEQGCKWSAFPFSLDDTNDMYRSIQEDICASLGWATPSQISGPWIRHCVSIAEARAKDYFATLEDDNPGLRSFLLALIARELTPYEVSANYRKDHLNSHMWFPVLICDDGDIEPHYKGVVWDGSKSMPQDRYAEFALHHGARIAAFGLAWDPLVQPRHHARIAEALVRYAQERHALDTQAWRSKLMDFLSIHS
jgi:hypothetical protein